ncbi:MAG: amidase [Alphaproteobacteria bacterium]|nr:amidase [Alphaproteobacteria bacterium]
MSTATDDPARMTLVEAADAVRARRISSRELTEASLKRIERRQPALNCFIAVDRDEALAAADGADAAVKAGRSLGLLHGVPLAHKDMYYRAGRVSTCGSKIRKDFRPSHTATVLERLDAAGALQVGTLNMSEFAFGPTGHNAHFGPARNPWNPAHITGGSSSGSGSAVGGRLVHGALGSDTGGSIRLPAAACGVVGIKATHGRVSRHGAMGISFSMDCVGPLARTARDCARLLAIIAGHDPKDPTSSRRPVPDYEAATVSPSVKGLKIGVPRNYFYDHATAEVKALLDQSLAVYRGQGAEIVEVTLPDHERLSDLASVLSTSEGATLHAAWLRERPGDYGAQVRARIQVGLAYPAVRYLEAAQVRAELMRRFVETVFGACDLLHAPVFAMPIPTIAETDMQDSQGFQRLIASLTHATRTINYLGLPSISVPAGFTRNGLPTAFQLVGRPFAEVRLFRAAALYEDATRWIDRMPPE